MNEPMQAAVFALDEGIIDTPNHCGIPMQLGVNKKYSDLIA